jgi:hypothetical protein
MCIAEDGFGLGNIFNGFSGRRMDPLDSRGRKGNSFDDLPAYLRVFKERVGFK